MNSAFTKRVMLFLLMVAVGLSQFTIPHKAHASSGANLALNPSRTGFPNPTITALATLNGETPWEAVDGQFSYTGVPHNRWTDWATGPATNWLTIDFGTATTFNQVKLYIFDDHGGVQPPSSYRIQYGDGNTWTNVTHSISDPATPAAQLNTVNFDAVTANQVRIVLNHGAAYVGLTEIEVYLNADTAAASPVKSLIDQLPEPGAVTLSALAAISAARTAYNNLTANQKNLITNLSKLIADETAIAPLLFQDVTVQSAIGNIAGDTVRVKLGSVVDATYSMQANKFQIEVNGAQTVVTNAVYDATDSSLQTIKLTLLSNELQNATSASLSILNGAFKMNNQTYNNTISSVPITTAVYSVITKIDQLPNQDAVTLSNQSAITAARTAYNNLTASQQSLVTNLNKLTAAEAAIAALQMTYEDVAVQSAFGNAAGDTITIKLASEVDATYNMQADHFRIVANGTQLTVTNAVYDTTDSSLHTIKLTLSSDELLHAASVAISIQNGALKTSHGTFNHTVSSFPVITFNKLDINQDNWIGVDDVTQIIGNPSLQLDVNQDGVFNRDDILIILGQISKRIMK